LKVVLLFRQPSTVDCNKLCTLIFVTIHAAIHFIMQVLTLFSRIPFVLTILVHHCHCDIVNIQSEKLVDFVGCNSSTIEAQAIRDAWDSAIDIAYVSSGKIEWGYHSSVDFLAGPDRNKAYQKSIKGKINLFTY
jgi:hypothetical protein